MVTRGVSKGQVIVLNEPMIDDRDNLVLLSFVESETFFEQLFDAMRAWDFLCFYSPAPDELVQTSPFLGTFGKVEVKAVSELGHGSHLLKQYKDVCLRILGP